MLHGRTESLRYLDVHQPLPCGERVALEGPVGCLEALIGCPEHPGARGLGIVCHPHPLMGGTMHNKVVHFICRAFNELGLYSLRFNFRGVGASEGTYGEGDGEAQDLGAALDWARTRAPDQALWLAGFSFGGWVALRQAHHPGVTQLVTVAPAVNRSDQRPIESPECPWLLVQGEQDEVVPATAVRRWLAGLARQPEAVFMPDAGHMFHGQLTRLRKILLERLAPAAEGLGR